jgi:hypothetical protein
MPRLEGIPVVITNSAGGEIEAEVDIELSLEDIMDLVSQLTEDELIALKEYIEEELFVW